VNCNKQQNDLQAGLEPWPFTLQPAPAGQPLSRLQNSLINHTRL